jgi:hypothetical protein
VCQPSSASRNRAIAKFFASRQISTTSKIPAVSSRAGKRAPRESAQACSFR